MQRLRLWYRRLGRLLRGCGSGLQHGRLAGLATVFATDKWSEVHAYTPHYQRHLRGRKVRRVLEIGVGGYESAGGGASLRMWQFFLPRAEIIGIDLHPKEIRGRRLTFEQCDQSDPDALNRIGQEYGPFDLIVDDGSHINDHVLLSFEVLFQHLRPGGLYVIEDLETAYYEEYGGGPPNAAGTSVARVKQLIDGLNHVYFDGPVHPVNRTDREVTGVHAYEGIVFIEKLAHSKAPRPKRWGGLSHAID